MASSAQNVLICAQNCNDNICDAFTGEVSVEMLSSIHVEHVIIGHSERRTLYNEDDAMLLKKVRLALSNNIIPIFCCGEPLKIRKDQKQNEYVINQLAGTVCQLSESEMEKCIIAYEPIWAIGTGETATAAQAQDMHLALRNAIATHFSEALSSSIPILYGGSVKPGNAQELFGQPDVDGGLVGGASLNVDDFLAIINSFN